MNDLNPDLFQHNHRLWMMVMLAAIVTFLSIPLRASAGSYYETSGEYRVVKDANILDYPDSRASSIGTLKKGSVVLTAATSGVGSGNMAILSDLLVPTSCWMIVQFSGGKYGYVWCNSRFEKISSDKKLAVPKDLKIFSAGREKYVKQGKEHLKWVGFVLVGLIILQLLAAFVDNDVLGLVAGLSIFAFEGMLVWYLTNNPHSMWFVSPTINGWWYTILCIIPTWFVVFFLISEFSGSISGVFDGFLNTSERVVNILSLVLLGTLLFLMGRAIYLEVLDLVTIVIWSMSGVGFRSSEDHGTLVCQNTSKFITGVRFSGNKAYSGNQTFTDNGSGYYE